MALHDIVLDTLSAHPLETLIFGPLVLLVIRSIYRLYFHPLSHIPGPILARVTSLWLYYHAYIGDEASAIHRLHLRFGSLVRVSPHEVDISDADAIQPIYASKGGFPKAPYYANFDIDGHQTIFSTTDHDHRAVRAKAVVALFSTKMLKDNEEVIWGCVDGMVEKLRVEAETKRPVDVLRLSRSLAVDTVSSYLFSATYNGMSEQGTLSVAAFVDSFVSVGRFFYLPNTVFVWLDWAIAKWLADRETDDSMALIDEFVGNLVARTTKQSRTFPGRLLAAGIAAPEVKAQCKDLIFAGTDSTGMNLATIMRNLALHPAKYARLKTEVAANTALGPDAKDVQALPYLTAVVKEALRISMANPTRLPHVVPAGGWTFKNTHFPPGSIVGCPAFELHFNADVFPAPRAFEPERWLGATEHLSKYWFAFGAGSRACIARSLATTELHFATERLASSGVLDGAKVVRGGEVDIMEWFNSKVKAGRVDLVWE